MNRNLLVAVIGILVIIGIGYALLGNSSPAQPTTTSEQDTTTVAPVESIESTVTLYEQNASNEFGTATLTEKNGEVVVALKLNGAPIDVAQPAHIHVGVCPDVGAVKYPLESPVNGVSETILAVTLDQLRSEQPLGLNVHKSGAEANVYVSCGDLDL